jgi:hypothetical protein
MLGFLRGIGICPERPRSLARTGGFNFAQETVQRSDRGAITKDRPFRLIIYSSTGASWLPVAYSSRYPPPWSVEETDTCFIVRVANRQALAYVYFEDEPDEVVACRW